MIEEKNGCLHPLMKLSENYLEILCKISDPEFKEVREELEKIYTRGQNLIYNAKDYKEMTKAFVSSSYELVMTYRNAVSPKPEETDFEYIQQSEYGPAKIAYTDLNTINSNIEDEVNQEKIIIFDVKDKAALNQFSQNLFNIKPAETEVKERLEQNTQYTFDFSKDPLSHIKKVEI